MDIKDKNEKTKETLANFWQKTSDISKKATESVKELAEQTKQNIHNAQAKKYIPVIAKEFKSKTFKLPNIIKIVDDTANRSFINDSEAIGWIEKYDDIGVLHLYSGSIKKCNLQFIPIPQQDNVYYADNFDSNKFINTNNIFGKAMEEKLSELEHIAHYLGAKSCSIEIVENDYENNSKRSSMLSPVSMEINSQSKNFKSQSGKIISHFEGNNIPKMPVLKWFAHDENIKRLIEMRCSDNNSIKSKILELKGSSSATMSKKYACAIDKILNIKGSLSMEKQTIKEYNNILLYKIEF